MRLELSGGGLTAVTTNPIVVSPAAPAALVIHTQPSSQATAGAPFALQPVIYEEDQYGNIETGDDSTVFTASLAVGVGPLQGASPTTVEGASPPSPDSPTTPRRRSSSRLSGGGLSVVTDPILVRPAAASRLVISTQPSTTAVAGEPLATQPVVYEEDRYGNLETGDDSTGITCASPTTEPDRLTGATATVTGGVATFSGLADEAAWSPVSFRFYGGGLTGGPSDDLVVSPACGQSARLCISTQPSPSGRRRARPSPSSR